MNTRVLHNTRKLDRYMPVFRGPLRPPLRPRPNQGPKEVVH